MSDHNVIVLTPDPRGRFIEGILSGALKPGTVLQLKAATEPVNGNHTWEAYNRDASGNRPQGPIAILVEDELQGRTVETALDTGQLCRLYLPLPGDEVQVLFDDPAGTGTGSDLAIGDIMTIVDGTGLIDDEDVVASPEITPFTVAETKTDLTADTLVHCFFSGY